MIRVTKKRKNPHLNDIEDFIKNNSSKFEYLDRGGEAKVFYFKLNKSLVLNTEVLKSGEYALKVYDDKFSKHNINGELSVKQISKLKLLSKYGLIPKIFIITKKYIISKFIHGIDYSEFGYNEQINDKINKLIEIWKKLGFEHDDLAEGNIIITPDLKVYLIDPYV